jgi:hypothetical protein
MAGGDLSVKNASWVDAVALDALIAEIRGAKEVTVYQKQPLPNYILELFRDLMAAETPPEVELVAEDLSDVAYLRQLYSLGIDVFYGVGLTRQPFIFLNARQGFVVEGHSAPALRSLSAKDAEDLYYRLLWRKFGHAVLLTGLVKENDPAQSLLSKTRRGKGSMVPTPHRRSGNYAGSRTKSQRLRLGKWVSQILEVIQLELLPSE